jgi:hypothetical protein
MIVASQLPGFRLFEDSFVSFEQFLILLVTTLVVSAFLIGWRYVSRLRCGERNQAGSLLPIARLTDLLPRRSAPFRTPAGAQFWFEWRTVGVLFPLIVTGVLILIILPLSWLLLTVPDPPGSTRNLVFWTLAMPVLLAHPFGIAMAKPSLWDADLGVPVITATRPMSAVELVAIRIKVASLSVVLTWAVVLVFLAVLPLWADYSALNRLATEWQAINRGSAASIWITAALIVLAAMWLTWRFMVSSLWIGLSGNKQLFNTLIVLVVLIPSVALIFNVFRLPGWLLENPGRLTALVWLLSLAVTAKVVLAAIGWRRVAPRLVAQYLLVTIAGTACFLLLGLNFRDALRTILAPGIDRFQTLAILVVLLIMPLARPGFAPAMLARNRHRE